MGFNPYSAIRNNIYCSFCAKIFNSIDLKLSLSWIVGCMLTSYFIRVSNSNVRKTKHVTRSGGRKPHTSKISEYYCQMTNNINISVDIDKKCRSAHDEFSERNESVNTSNSGNSILTQSIKGRNEMLQKIRNRQNQFDSMRRAADIDSTRKIAGKHISIFLNTK